MPLNAQQKNALAEAIAGYRFQARYFDFQRNCPIEPRKMAETEVAFQKMLTSQKAGEVRDGLANVVYWGYNQIGFQKVRVERFCSQVSDSQIVQFQNLVASHGIPSMVQIRAIRMPQYSGVSFISKILTFLNPIDYCVLDLQLARLAIGSGARALGSLKNYGTQLPVTEHNEGVYHRWRSECREISRNYFHGKFRVVDIERGFFQMIQDSRPDLALQIYAAA